MGGTFKRGRITQVMMGGGISEDGNREVGQKRGAGDINKIKMFKTVIWKPAGSFCCGKMFFHRWLGADVLGALSLPAAEACWQGSC